MIALRTYLKANPSTKRLLPMGRTTSARVYEQALLKKGVTLPRGPAERAVYWEADHYGLERLSAYRALGDDERRALLLDLNAFSIQESCLVENVGFRFNSKMMLMAETLEERSLFANFAHDEAIHLNSLIKFCEPHGEPETKSQPMIRLLDQIVDESSYATTSYIIQVVLEGFGLAHYSTLGENCRDEELGGIIARIVRDEAFHHAGGKAVFSDRGFAVTEEAELVDALHRVSTLFARWPHPLLRAFALRGYTDRAYLAAIVAELAPAKKAQLRIDYVKRLLSHLPTATLARLEAGGAFGIPTESAILDAYFASPINPVQ